MYDLADIVRENRVGVIVDGPDSAPMRAAHEDLKRLMRDPDLQRRCRTTAETVFSLSAGTEAYHSLYAAILRMEEGGILDWREHSH